MRILAIDTATEACSAALYFEGEINQQYRVAPREHSHIILPMIERLLVEAGIRVSELDALAFGRGPGSFMGVRIAAGVTQGIAFAWDLPVVPVSTLAAIAQTAHTETGATSVLSAIDARMNEVYWGAYRLSEQGCMQLVGEERVIAPDQVDKPGEGGWTGAGSGWSAYGETLKAAIGPGMLSGYMHECFPTAASIVRLAVAEYQAGRHVPASKAVPVYLRDNVAKKSAA
jgi:tRNA threonylcarbamoyladenosine biosynthesis protein TsaB